MNGLGKSLVAINLGKAIEKTCIHCGDIEELCNCKEFENIKGRKKSNTNHEEEKKE